MQSYDDDLLPPWAVLLGEPSVVDGCSADLAQMDVSSDAASLAWAPLSAIQSPSCSYSIPSASHCVVLPSGSSNFQFQHSPDLGSCIDDVAVDTDALVPRLCCLQVRLSYCWSFFQSLAYQVDRDSRYHAYS